jgi:hypothetical protein
MASLPNGAETSWHLTLPFKEMWIFGRPYEKIDGPGSVAVDVGVASPGLP